jgi:hypothetical protein
MQLLLDLAGKEKTQEDICGFKNEEAKNENAFSLQWMTSFCKATR